MSQLDFSIPGRALASLPNPAANLQQALSLKDVMQQAQLRDVQLQDAMDQRQRTMSLRDTLRGAIGADGTLDGAKVRAAYAGAGDLEGLTAFNTAEAQQARAKREAEKAQLEQSIMEHKTIAQLAAGVRDEASWGATLDRADAMGLDTAAFRKVPYSPQLVQSIRMSALDVAGQLEQEWKAKNFSLEAAKFGETQRSNRVAEGQRAESNQIARYNATKPSEGQVVETPNGPMIVDRRTGQARPVTMGGQRVGSDASQKRASGSRRVLALVDQAEKLITQATGSYAGAGADAAARIVGASTPGSKSIARLRAIEGAILAEMPRMEGPQSNIDVQMYRQAAGSLADPTIPVEDKRAALDTIREIQTRYAGGASAPTNRELDPLGLF